MRLRGRGGPRETQDEAPRLISVLRCVDYIQPFVATSSADMRSVSAAQVSSLAQKSAKPAVLLVVLVVLVRWSSAGVRALEKSVWVPVGVGWDNDDRASRSEET